MNEHLSVGEQFYRLVDQFENAPPDCRQTPDGCALDAYLCPSEQWTIGDGCCFWEDGTPVKQGDTLPDGPELEARRKSLLAYNARYCEEYVREYVTVPLTQNQFDALCDFRFNTRETTLRNSSRLLPAVNAQEWQKAATAFSEFVYGTSTFEGKPYQKAMRGLLRRRLWQSLIFLGYDPAEAVKSDDVALPCDRRLLSSGVYRDMIRSEGLTTLNQVRAKASPLVSELVLNTPAPPLVATTRVPDGKAEQPGADPQSQPPVVSAPPVSPAQTVPPVVARKPEVVASPPAAAPRAPVPASTVPPKPIIIAPQPINPNALPTNADTVKNMADSTRMVGMVLVAIGSIIQVVTLRLGIGTAIGAVFFDLTRDPVVITLAVTAVVAALGWVTKRNGKKTFAKGADQAQGNLY
jgi:lysozyme